MRQRNEYWNKETRKLDQDAKQLSPELIHGMRIPLVLNNYQLANLLRALRLSENTGDWHGEILGQINFQLSSYGFNIAESYLPPIEDEEPYPFEYCSPPNLPYPDGFKESTGRFELDSDGKIKEC